MTVFSRSLIIFGAVSLLTGCGTQPTKAPDGVKVYESVQELQADYVAAGGHCPSFEADDAVKGSSSSGICRYPDDPDSWISGLSVFPDTASRDELLDWWERMANDGRTESWTALVGPNWVINEPSDVEKSLGGEKRYYNQ
jgi:hypothetical protein